MMRFPAVLLGDKVAVGSSVFGMQSHALSIRLGGAYLRCNGAVQDARKVTVVKGSGNGSQDSGTGEPVRGMKVFAEELRAQRDNRGWTQLELAAELQYSNSFVSDVERAVKVPSSGFAEQCDKVFGLPGTFVRLLEIAKITIYPDYFAPVIPYEEKSARVSGFELGSVPGLLQTEEYARAQIRATLHEATGEYIESLVTARIERQRIFTGETPTNVWYVLDESTLRRVVGNADVMGRQIDRLIAVAETPGNVIQVLTFKNGGGIGSAGSLTIFELRDGAGMVAYMETNRGGRLIEDRKELDGRVQFMSLIRVSALSPRDSTEFMREIRREYDA
jgi:transcriptional regulator with XRE-family HTH domain